MSLSIIILAAGKGTRMKSSLPKVLHKICGYEMLYYSIKEAKKITNDIEIVLYHQADLIKEKISKYFDDLNFVIQDLEKYPGTGGAVMNCKPKNEKVLILNADMPLVEAKELESFSSIDADIVMSVIELENPSGYGRVIIRDGEVEKIVEEKDATDEEKRVKSVNAGVYLIKRELLEKFLPKLNNNNKQKEYYLTDIIELAKKEGYKIAPIFVREEHFKGVNSKYDLAEAEVLMANRIKKNLMLNGVVMRLPDTIYIEEGVEFEGECIIENGVSIYKNSKISNSHIKANTIIEESQIINSSVGPLARIRPGSKIEESHIGNFVEVKKSSLKGVKAGHLSYLGDSQIDEGTNIGAGTITCNYDGIRKYKTVIGKNVFVGSDTQIIAPVTIEDDVLIAAGTTVNRDVPKGSLAISRLGMKTVSGFFYKFFSKKKCD